MRITSLTLKNWRAFKVLELADIGQRLIVVGPNASGKSNLLDSIRFLRDLALPGGGFQAAVRSRGGVPKVRCLFARNHNRGQVEITVTLGDDERADRWAYSLSFRSEPKGLHRPVVTKEVVRKDGEVILERPEATDDEDPERLTQTALEQISANREFRAIADFFAETRYLHLVPQVIRDASRSGDVTDDPFGGDFIARMNQVQLATRRAWLRRLTEALQIAVPQFESLEIVVDSAGRPHLEGRYTNWRTSAARQDESDFSDGTLRLIGLLWSLIEVGRRAAPVLLEEPELSLHPAVVEVLPRVLATVQRSNGVQVLLTTHSPDLLADEGIGADEVLELIPTQDGTIGRVLADVAEVVDDVDSGIPLSDIFRARSKPPGIEALPRVKLVAG